ncbi:hypothetical protein J4438_01685 [Candidatus Woesearchaeota archaeon]|nr:hypothetical protein [Candidatus Woesearchaeota archaeon]
MGNKTNRLDELMADLDETVTKLTIDLPKLENISDSSFTWENIFGYLRQNYDLQLKYLVATSELDHEDPIKNEELMFRRIKMFEGIVQTIREYATTERYAQLTEER